MPSLYLTTISHEYEPHQHQAAESQRTCTSSTLAGGRRTGGSHKGNTLGRTDHFISSDRHTLRGLARRRKRCERSQRPVGCAECRPDLCTCIAGCTGGHGVVGAGAFGGYD